MVYLVSKPPGQSPHLHPASNFAGVTKSVGALSHQIAPRSKPKMSSDPQAFLMDEDDFQLDEEPSNDPFLGSEEEQLDTDGEACNCNREASSCSLLRTCTHVYVSTFPDAFSFLFFRF